MTHEEIFDNWINTYIGDCFLDARLDKDLRMILSYATESKSRNADMKCLPIKDTYTVYRGCEVGNENGLSWTLDLETAEYFADLYDGIVFQKLITRDEIVAYIPGSEKEIILNNTK